MLFLATLIQEVANRWRDLIMDWNKRIHSHTRVIQGMYVKFQIPFKTKYVVLNRYSGTQWFMSHWRGSSDLDQTWSMWSVDIPKKAHWVKKIFFFPPEPPGGAQFFYYMEIEAAVLAMFEHESNFFFFAWRGTKNSPGIKWKKFGLGPFLIRLVHLLLKSTYIQHGPTGWRK